MDFFVLWQEGDGADSPWRCLGVYTADDGVGALTDGAKAHGVDGIYHALSTQGGTRKRAIQGTDLVLEDA